MVFIITVIIITKRVENPSLLGGNSNVQRKKSTQDHLASELRAGDHVPHLVAQPLGLFAGCRVVVQTLLNHPVPDDGDDDIDDGDDSDDDCDDGDGDDGDGDDDNDDDEKDWMELLDSLKYKFEYPSCKSCHKFHLH